MQPELPKVELPKPPEFNQGQTSSDAEVHSNNDQQIKEANIQSAGSVGAEAGLTNFESIQPNQGRPIKNQSTATDDVESTTTTAVDNINNSLPRSASKAAVDTSPQVAADNDEIEKVWVDKAKKIVQQTKGDPYMQERATSRLQADYMKKRFDKDVKLPKESK